MFWTATPVSGVMEAKLPQFTIVGFETTDRKETLATGTAVQPSSIVHTPIGLLYRRDVPALIIAAISQTQHRLFHLPDISAFHFDCGKQCR